MQKAKTIRQLRDCQKRYGLAALAMTAAAGAVCALAGWPAAGRGVVLGGVFSAVNFVLMGEAAALKFVVGGGRRLTPLVILVGRYALLAAPVVAAVNLPGVDLPATVAGVFAVQACIVLDAVRGALKGGRAA